MFILFGMNTFAGNKWGDGTDDPGYKKLDRLSEPVTATKIRLEIKNVVGTPAIQEFALFNGEVCFKSLFNVESGGSTVLSGGGS